jgi:SpoVK/Ycf46/Vps4 family AAA+-type ATPase
MKLTTEDKHQCCLPIEMHLLFSLNLLLLPAVMGLVFSKGEYSTAWMGEPRMKCTCGTARNISDHIERITCLPVGDTWDCSSNDLPKKTVLGKCIVNCKTPGEMCILRYCLDFIEKFEPRESRFNEIFAELTNMTGLAKIKERVRQLANMLTIQKIRESHNLPTLIGNQHMIFAGNPGTGKTMVARLLASIYHELGFLTKGHLIETDRSKLVIGYVGQTANNTREIIESAVGGVLLIDEAYSLAFSDSDRDFGYEAIDTLVKYMEDLRDNLVVIATGYSDEMMSFLASNHGVRSRFSTIIDFPDYSDDELVEIFNKTANVFMYHPDPATIERLRLWCAAQERTKYFGNAREMRTLFEKTIRYHADRLMKQESFTQEDLTHITVQDLENAINDLIL